MLGEEIDVSWILRLAEHSILQTNYGYAATVGESLLQKRKTFLEPSSIFFFKGLRVKR